MVFLAVSDLEHVFLTRVFFTLTLPTIQKPSQSFTSPKTSKKEFRSLSMAPPRIALLLHGCGFQDGSEINESMSFILHVDRLGASLSTFAPDIPQMHVVDHIQGAPSEETSIRSVKVESARIVRGNIADISTLNVNDFDALIVPGGFGIAKNFSTFATAGKEMVVNEAVSAVLVAFHKAKKPIGLSCVAPILIGKVLPQVKITLGKASGEDWPWAGIFNALKDMGANVVECEADAIVIDTENRVVTGPAYMHNSTPYQVYTNIGDVVEATLALIPKEE